MIACQQQRFDVAPFAPMRFGARAADIEWLRHQVSRVVSSGYRSHNR
jgi:hypothetical protein